jgi:TonB family protein
VAWQSQVATALENETAGRRATAADPAARRAETARTGSLAAEVAALRRDEAALAATQAELTALRARPSAARPAPASPRATVRPRPALEKFNGPVIEPRQLEKQPVPVAQTAPVYPPSLRQLAIAGEATLEFVVDAQGAVHLERAFNATHPDFADAALEAVARWKFTPGMLAGSAVNTRLQVPILFQVAADDDADAKPSRPPPAPRPGGIGEWF